MAGVILLSPSGLAQTQSEHGGDELHGGHADHDADDNVDLLAEEIVDFGKASRVHVGVFVIGVSHTSRVHGVKVLDISNQLAAGLWNLGKIVIFLS